MIVYCSFGFYFVFVVSFCIKNQYKNYMQYLFCGILERKDPADSYSYPWNVN